MFKKFYREHLKVITLGKPGSRPEGVTKVDLRAVWMFTEFDFLRIGSSGWIL